MKISANFKKRVEKLLTPIKKYAWWLTLVFLGIVGAVLIIRPAVSLIRTSYEIRQLNNQKAIYEEQILRDSLLMEQLKNDEFLEQYARETYFMQRPNEQVFIIGE